MKHVSTREVYAHWKDRRRDRPAPPRADIDPVAIRRALGDTFMLSTDFVDELRFRLAGTRVCALFGREMKGETFLDLWSEKTSDAVDELLSIITAESEGVVAGLTGRTDDGFDVELEMLLLPLLRVGRGSHGMLGVLAPTVPAYWIGTKPVVRVDFRTVRHLGAETASVPQPMEPPPEGVEVRHGFTVYSGGRQDDPPSERSA